MDSRLNQFSENRVEFDGFNDFYTEKIFPYLHTNDLERRQKERVVKSIFVSMITIGVVLAILALYLKGSWRLSIFLFFVCFALAGFAYKVIFQDFTEQTKYHLMRNICEFLGWKYSPVAIQQPDMYVWQSNGLLPKCNSVEFEDQMSGKRRGLDFTFCEALLERPSYSGNGSTVILFQGILLEVDFHKKFLGQTVVLREAIIINRKRINGMKRVGLVDPKFERIFEAYGTDQVEARYLLTPDFMQQILNLESRFQGKNCRFGFIEEKLYIAIEAPNQFEAGSMFQPMMHVKRTQKILDEVSAIFDVIDGVMKPQNASRVRST